MTAWAKCSPRPSRDQRGTTNSAAPTSGPRLLASLVRDGEIGCVLPPHRSNPPYGLVPATFRFAALAALAGRAPLGGPREIAMAVFLVARLADDASPANGLAEELRVQRAAGAKHWLASVVLPAAIRNALAQLVDATAGASPSVAQAVRTVTKVAANQLDAAARLELERLAAALDSQTIAG